MTVRQLQMHRQLLLDVVKRQAGTLHKAVLEGVMNAIEAGAPRVDIGFDVDDKGIARMSITDGGNGITSLKDIEDFFETFGTPHSESENKRWAQFRMGRGQLFSFGKNTWRTGPFKMFVDIEDMGLAYDLEQGLDDHKGCRIDIELYTNPIGQYNNYSSVDNFCDCVQEQVEFMDTPIYFNGKKLNRDVSKIEWTDEDEYAYYLFGVGSDLVIYNLGAFVCKHSTWRMGVNGIILSKHQLKVNFARNDIQSDCPIYDQIQKVVAKHRRKKVTNRKSALTNDERTSLLLDMRDGGIELKDNKNVALLRTAVGRAMSIANILRNRLPWSFAPKDNQKADKLMQSDKALVFDEGLLSELRYSGDPSGFFTWLVKDSIDKGWHQSIEETSEYKKWKKLEGLYVPFDQLANGLRESFSTIPHNKLTMREKYILRTLESYDCWDGRALSIGISDVASAWTDGSSYISMDRNWIQRLSLPYADGCAQLVNILVHELAHDCDTSGSHVHGEEFYRRFHDLCVRNSYPCQRIIADFHTKLNRSKAMYKEEQDEQKRIKMEAKRAEVLAASAK